MISGYFFSYIIQVHNRQSTQEEKFIQRELKELL